MWMTRGRIMDSIFTLLTLATVGTAFQRVPVSLANRAASTNLDFLVVGDFGGLPVSPYSTAIERNVADAMNDVAGEQNTKFQLALGDNFYYTGVKSVTDKRFRQTFESVYNGDFLQTDWYLFAGNHDWKGNVAAQIEYSKISSRWNFPFHYYSKNFTTPDGASVQILMLDTIILCGHLMSDFMDVDDSSYYILDQEQTDTAWEWLEFSLRNSKTDYLLVAGHFPVYSAGMHGPTTCLVDRLQPMLHTYGASAYMCGHDHNLQHIQEKQDDSTMNYFVIGSGNFANNSTAHASDVPKDSLQFHNGSKDGGFAHVSINTKAMSVTVYSGKKKELYYTEIGPRADKFRN